MDRERGREGQRLESKKEKGRINIWSRRVILHSDSHICNKESKNVIGVEPKSDRLGIGFYRVDRVHTCSTVNKNPFCVTRPWITRDIGHDQDGTYAQYLLFHRQDNIVGPS